MDMLISSPAMDRLVFTVSALRLRLDARLPSGTDIDSYIAAAMPSLVLLASNQED